MTDTINFRYAERFRFADGIAKRLHEELASGARAKFGIDEIEEACDAAWTGPPDAELRDDLIGLICRRAVWQTTSMGKAESAATKPLSGNTTAVPATPDNAEPSV